ncbi:MAG: hypothetical protein JWM61_2999, partial [Micrococcaceae bacterium]|nr:hypothetical protein [Micrococcaceae bacterium]
MTVETDTDAAPRPLPSRASTGASVQESVTGVAPTIAFFFAIAALICMGELDRLIGAGLDSVRSSATLSQVQGPFSLTHLDAWATWHDSQLSAIATWIQFSIWCDFVFLAAYGWGLIVLSAQIRKSERPDWGPLVFAVLLVIIDAAENVFVLWLSGGLAEPDGNYEATGAVIVGVLATIKWILVVFTVISIARSPAFAEIAGPVIRRARHASYVHRLGLTMIIALAVLGLVPTGSIVFDQLPDVQRAWVDDGPLLVSGHAIVAALLIVLAAYGLWVVATAASDRDDEQTGRKPTSPHMWILIWVGVATLFVIGVIFQRTDWRLLPTLWLLIYLTVTMLLSYFLRSRTFEPLPDFDETHSAAARATGNLLPILLLGVGMLGLIRSFVGPTALVMVSDPSSDDRGGDIVWSFVLAAAGLLVVPLAAAILVTLGTRNDAIPGSRTHRTLQRITGPFGMSVASFVAIVLLAAFIVNPIGFARFFGVVGTAIVGLGSWAVLVGTAAAVIDSRHPLPLFRALRMRNTPILSVLL